MNNWAKNEHLAKSSGILFIPKVVLLLVTFWLTKLFSAQGTESSEITIPVQAGAARACLNPNPAEMHEFVFLLWATLA